MEVKRKAFLLIATGLFLFATSIGVVIEWTTREGRTVLHFGTTLPESMWPAELFEGFSERVREESGGGLEVVWRALPERLGDTGLLQRLYLRELDGGIVGGEAISKMIENKSLFRDPPPTERSRWEELQRRLSERLKEKGYEAIGWLPVQPAYYFSRRSVSRRGEDREASRNWIEAGYLIPEGGLRKEEVPSILTAPSEVERLLLKGEIDGIVGSLLVADRLGWLSHAKVMLKEPIGYRSAVVMVRSERFHRLDPLRQASIKKATTQMIERASVLERERESELLQKWSDQGLKVEPASTSLWTP